MRYVPFLKWHDSLALHRHRRKRPGTRQERRRPIGGSRLAVESLERRLLLSDVPVFQKLGDLRLPAGDVGAGDAFGTSVAFDGDIAVVGAPFNDELGRDAGAAYIFLREDPEGTPENRDDDTWKKVWSLYSSDAVSRDHFGISAAVAHDGMERYTVAIGADGADGAARDSGMVYIFTSTDGGENWSLGPAELRATDGSRGDSFGGRRSLSISGDTIVVGAPFANGSGSVYVFKKDGEAWVDAEEDATILAPDGNRGDRFGHSVSISGNTIAVGADGAAAAYVFQRDINDWPIAATLTRSDGGDLGSIYVFARDMAPSPGITVDPTAGLETSENGAIASFTVVLDTQPTAPVAIDISSSDETEGTIVGATAGVLTLTFNTADWDAPQTVTVQGINDFDTDGDQAYAIELAPAISVDLDYGGRDATDVAVTNLDDEPSMATDDYAIGETTFHGTVTVGTYFDTHASDDVYEAIKEELYAGKKRSRLAHQWTFNVTSGNSVTFFVEAYHDSTAEDFVFEYSTNGGSSWSQMLTVDKSTDDDTVQPFDLPGTVSGTVLVQVRDTDQSRGEKTLDTIYVDEMYFVSTSGGGGGGSSTLASPAVADTRDRSTTSAAGREFGSRRQQSFAPALPADWLFYDGQPFHDVAAKHAWESNAVTGYTGQLPGRIVLGLSTRDRGELLDRAFQDDTKSYALERLMDSSDSDESDDRFEPIDRALLEMLLAGDLV